MQCLFHLNFLSFFLVFTYLVECVDVGSKQNKPNIILVVADDLGFNDVPWHNKEVFAPNLLQLAKKGVILEQSYVQPICSPTRSAILTGTYPFALGRQDGVIWPLMPTGLTLDVPIIPQLLKPLGYDTHAVGKWHLGFCKWAYTPTERGFDTFRGYYTGSEHYYSHVRNYGSSTTADIEEGSLDSLNEAEADLHETNEICFNETNALPVMEKASDPEDIIELDSEKENSTCKPQDYDFRNNRDPYYEAYGTYSTYEFASHLEDVFEKGNSTVPKFVYMAFQSVHAPLEVPQNYTKYYKHIKNKQRRTYLGMVSAMDEAIGRIVTALKKSNRYKNSVIVFTTDNGGPTIFGGNNWPLRGNKTTLWEGGTRGAAFVHSPLLSNKGSVSDTLIHTTDWMSTIVNLAGGEMANGTDSIDQWNAIKGKLKSPPRKTMVYNINNNKKHGFSAAIRRGNYKLIIGYPGPGDWTPPPEVKNRQRRKNEPLEAIKNMKKTCHELHCFRAFMKNYKKIHSQTNAGIVQKTLKLMKKFISRRKSRKHTNKTGWRRRGEAKNNTSVEGVEREDLENQIIHDHFINFTDLVSVDDVHRQKLPYRLYNLKHDPQERRNLAPSMPTIVNKLVRFMLSYKTRWVTPDEPKNDQRGSPKYWGGVWSPGWC